MHNFYSFMENLVKSQQSGTDLPDAPLQKTLWANFYLIITASASTICHDQQLMPNDMTVFHHSYTIILMQVSSWLMIFSINVQFDI